MRLRLGPVVLPRRDGLPLSRHPDRQKLAQEFGATDIVDTRGDQAVEDVKNLTEGVGVDAALEMRGH